LRKYRRRLPRGQAVTRAFQEELSGTRGITMVRPNQINKDAASDDQIVVLEDAEFLNSTPPWYYVLAEAAISVTTGPRHRSATRSPRRSWLD
jgi:hypothetical protein